MLRAVCVVFVCFYSNVTCKINSQIIGFLSWPEHLCLLPRDSLKFLLQPRAKDTFSGTPAIPVNRKQLTVLFKWWFLSFHISHPREMKKSRQLLINLISTSPLIAKTSWKGWKSEKAWLNSESIHFSTLLGWFEFVLGIIPVQTLLTTFPHDDHSLWCAVAAQTCASDPWLSSNKNQNCLPGWWTERIEASTDVKQGREWEGQSKLLKGQAVVL